MFNNSAALTMPVVPANYGYGNGGGMFGGNSGDIWGLLILLALFGGWGNGGFGFGGGYGGGGAGFQGLATRADINEGFALNNITGGITAIQQGICDSTYALTNAINGGFHGVDNGFHALSAQLAQCCCDNRAAIADVKYQMATDTCGIQNTIQNTTRDILESNNANTRAILDYMSNSRLEDLRAENTALKAQIGISNQNAFIAANQEAQTAEILRRLSPIPVPSYTVPNPNCCYGGQALYGNSCAGC